jgi:hypothetical protein
LRSEKGKKKIDDGAIILPIKVEHDSKDRIVPQLTTVIDHSSVLPGFETKPSWRKMWDDEVVPNTAD